MIQVHSSTDLVTTKQYEFTFKAMDDDVAITTPFGDIVAVTLI